MAQKTALLLIDPLNEFLHPDGKLYPRLQPSLEASSSIENMRRLVAEARKQKIPVFYCQHQLTPEGHFECWNHKSKSQQAIEQMGSFRLGSFGGKIYEGLEPDPLNGDVEVSRHWNSSSFANTDLDYQLHQRDITHIVCAGMVANTCLESTARYGVELGYHTTIISDATAGFSIELRDVGEKIVWPTIVDKVLTVDQWAKSFDSTHHL